MQDLFGVPWSELRAEHVEAFLGDADEEGITWEAKADHPDSPLKTAQIQKAACGLANQIGGYLLIGAKKATSGAWVLPGILPPSKEPKLWLAQAMHRLLPAPPTEMQSWAREDGRVAAVVRVQPVAVPPCMTPEGRIYLRMPSETLPVKDPAVLHRLVERGERARTTADLRSKQCSGEAIAAPAWTENRCVAFAVALSPIGRETDDISSRLFTPATREGVSSAAWNLLSAIRGDGAQPDGLEIRVQQDSIGVFIDFKERRVWAEDGQTVECVFRSTWLARAKWDGSVAASVTLSDGDLKAPLAADDYLTALWNATAPLATALGGYGPTQLTAIVDVTQTTSDTVEGSSIRAGGRVPPIGSAFSGLGKQTVLGRLLDTSAPNPDTVESLGRELRRAAGHIEDEPH